MEYLRPFEPGEILAVVLCVGNCKRFVEKPRIKLAASGAALPQCIMGIRLLKHYEPIMAVINPLSSAFKKTLELRERIVPQIFLGKSTEDF